MVLGGDWSPTESCLIKAGSAPLSHPTFHGLPPMPSDTSFLFSAFFLGLEDGYSWTHVFGSDFAPL